MKQHKDEKVVFLSGTTEQIIMQLSNVTRKKALQRILIEKKNYL